MSQDDPLREKNRQIDGSSPLFQSSKVKRGPRSASFLKGFLILGGLALLIQVIFFVGATYETLFPSWYRREMGMIAQQPPSAVRLPECSRYQKRVYSGYCQDPKLDFGFAFEDLGVQTFEAANGRIQSFTGWFVPSETMPWGAAPLVILLHGGGADRRAMLKHLPYLHRRGLHALLLEAPNHGLSRNNGKGISLGLYESEAILAAQKWVKDKGVDGPVVYFGTSQGGFAALRAASLIGSGVKAVIAENPYASVRMLGEGERAKFGLVSGMVDLWLMALSLWHGMDFRLLDVGLFSSYIRAPVLLIHGSADQVVPAEHSQWIADKLPVTQREYWLVPYGEHEFLWNRFSAEYEARVLAFLARVGVL